MSFKFRALIAPLAVACSFAGVTQAQATDLSFSAFSHGAQTVKATLTAPNAPYSELVQAGGVTASMDGGASFTTYCVDLFESISLGPTYTNYVAVKGDAHAFSNTNANTDIGKLFGGAHVVNSATTEAAFQIAVWELAYETSGTYSLANGTAQFSGGSAASSGALALASTWLNAVSTASSTYSLNVLESVGSDGVLGHQDQVYAGEAITVAVPEPSTYALMAAGLLCIGFLGRRRAGQNR
jgi:hypothetical protein